MKNKFNKFKNNKRKYNNYKVIKTVIKSKLLITTIINKTNKNRKNHTTYFEKNIESNIFLKLFYLLINLKQ